MCPEINNATTCPHYADPNLPPGATSVCRGCGALLAYPSSVDPGFIDTYPAIAGAPATPEALLSTGNIVAVGPGSVDVGL